MKQTQKWAAQRSARNYWMIYIFLEILYNEEPADMLYNDEPADKGKNIIQDYPYENAYFLKF